MIIAGQYEEESINGNDYAMIATLVVSIKSVIMVLLLTVYKGSLARLGLKQKKKAPGPAPLLNTAPPPPPPPFLF